LFRCIAVVYLYGLAPNFSLIYRFAVFLMEEWPLEKHPSGQRAYAHSSKQTQNREDWYSKKVFRTGFRCTVQQTNPKAIPLCHRI